LDGYIAGPKGEADWIVMDPEIDFNALFQQFDTLLMGRKTYEGALKMGGASWPGMKTIVFSGTLRKQDHPNVTIVADEWRETVAALRAERGKDIWLFGGGQLFRSFLAADLVDSVEVAIIPVLLGNGIPLLPAASSQVKLELTGHTVYRTSGIVLLEYAVSRLAERPDR
jgi:dihydrofolate reductase